MSGRDRGVSKPAEATETAEPPPKIRKQSKQTLLSFYARTTGAATVTTELLPVPPQPLGGLNPA
jgi:hypothetical protein